MTTPDTPAAPASFVQFDYDPGQPTPVDSAEAQQAEASADLGLLAGFAGTWTGHGFNQIWRPVHDRANPAQDRFLELNLTTELLQFDTKGLGSIPNRGLLQNDIFMSGIRYLQAINDVNSPNHEGLHLEPGIWLNVPATTAPNVPASVARLASIPHGTSLVAQGLAKTTPGGPTFDPVDITPFFINQPTNRLPFPESNLSVPTKFRTKNLTNITQAMVDNPNTVLASAIAGVNIASTTTFRITSANMPIIGGGTANTAFLEGVDGNGNADAAEMTAVFWLETLAGQSKPTKLQYTQTVLLNFNGLSWPHVSVATLTLG